MGERALDVVGLVGAQQDVHGVVLLHDGGGRRQDAVAVAAAVPSVAVAATAAGLPNSGPVPQTRYEEAPVTAFAGSSSNAAVKAMEAATIESCALCANSR